MKNLINAAITSTTESWPRMRPCVNERLDGMNVSQLCSDSKEEEEKKKRGTKRTAQRIAATHAGSARGGQSSATMHAGGGQHWLEMLKTQRKSR